MLEPYREAETPFGADDVFLETVEDARLHTGLILEAAAAGLKKFSSQNAVCERTGRSFSGRIAYVSRAYIGDRRVVMQILHLGRAAIGEVQAQQTLSSIREGLKRFFMMAAPRSAIDEEEQGDSLTLNLANGTMRVTIAITAGETSLMVLS